MLHGLSQLGINDVVNPIHPTLNPSNSNILYGFVSKSKPSILPFIILSHTGEYDLFK